ncbi:MAG: hypothetical protein WCJ35_02035 [Planctomycetota bacterium]
MSPYLKSAVGAFLVVDPLLILLLRRLREHRAWYMALWTPLMALLVFGPTLMHKVELKGT